MTITKKQHDNTMEIAIEGRLDTNTCQELESEFGTVPEGIEEIILDLTDLEYISSAGLRILLKKHKEMYGKGRIRIVNANEIVKEVFEVTGFDKILCIE